MTPDEYNAACTTVNEIHMWLRQIECVKRIMALGEDDGELPVSGTPEDVIEIPYDRIKPLLLTQIKDYEKLITRLRKEFDEL